MKHIYIIFLIFILNSTTLCYGLSCKDENDRNVDWYIVYKLPKISNEPSGSDLFKGKSYSYLSPNENKWRLSNIEITSQNSVLGRTWKELKANEKSATYLFYNDDTPDVFNGSAVGHLKGILAFDENSGFWLSHSIPRFGRLINYEYPENAVTNGQHAFCVTFKTEQLDEICKHLLFAHPNIYLRKLTNTVSAIMKDNSAKSLFTDKPNFVRSEPFQRQTTLVSNGGLKITGFAKDNQLKIDLYSNLISRELKTSLYVETWRRGAGTYLPPFCEVKHTVVDITAINMTALEGSKRKKIYFRSTEDHSKWAISTTARKNIVCMADMNRMASQERRGGGALCFQSNSVWRQFKDIIGEFSGC